MFRCTRANSTGTLTLAGAQHGFRELLSGAVAATVERQTIPAAIGVDGAPARKNVEPNGSTPPA